MLAASRRDDEGTTIVASFGYARGVAPPMWVLFGIGVIELFVLHLLLSHWWPRVALVVGVATALSLAWLAWTIRSFDRLPVLVGSNRIVLRTGRLKALTVSLSDVTGVSRDWSSGRPRDRATANLALIAYPNVMIHLRTLVAWRGRDIRSIAHKLDDPDGFVRAVEAATAGVRE